MKEVGGVWMFQLVDDDGDGRDEVVGLGEHLAEGLHHFEVKVVDLESVLPDTHVDDYQETDLL